MGELFDEESPTADSPNEDFLCFHIRLFFCCCFLLCIHRLFSRQCAFIAFKKTSCSVKAGSTSLLSQSVTWSLLAVEALGVVARIVPSKTAARLEIYTGEDR